MPSNVHAFNLAVGKAGEEIPGMRIQALHRAVAMEALRGVVLMSPVDTGRFRGNWQVTVDAPAVGTLETIDKAGGATIAAGAAVIGGIRPYSTSWAVNNLDYAESLERGHSKQAPAGVLAVTMNRILGWLRSAP